jgi:hypothetical protein
MRFLMLTSLLVLLFQLLKLVWLWFKPAFLKKAGFDRPESKLMLTAYYLLTTLVLAAVVADQLGYIKLISPV